MFCHTSIYARFFAIYSCNASADPSVAFHSSGHIAHLDNRIIISRYSACISKYSRNFVCNLTVLYFYPLIIFPIVNISNQTSRITYIIISCLFSCYSYLCKSQKRFILCSPEHHRVGSEVSHIAYVPACITFTGYRDSLSFHSHISNRPIINSRNTSDIGRCTCNRFRQKKSIDYPRIKAGHTTCTDLLGIYAGRNFMLPTIIILICKPYSPIIFRSNSSNCRFT